MIRDVHSMPLRAQNSGATLANTEYNHKVFGKNFVYVRNSEGYRSEEFQKNPMFLFAGCSETFGESADYETTWAYKLFNRLKDNNDSYCNIGLPGIDVSLTIHHIMMFIEKYGKPKNIFVVFPQFNRVIETSEDSVSTVTFGDIPEEKNAPAHDNVMFVEERIINAVQSSNLLHVKNFERFCEEVGVNLIWGTWCANSHLKVMQEGIFNNYVSILSSMAVADLAVDLGYELKEESITRADKNHHGEIFHEHWSNVFYDKYKENSK